MVRVSIAEMQFLMSKPQCHSNQESYSLAYVCCWFTKWLCREWTSLHLLQLLDGSISISVFWQL